MKLRVACFLILVTFYIQACTIIFLTISRPRLPSTSSYDDDDDDRETGQPTEHRRSGVVQAVPDISVAGPCELARREAARLLDDVGRASDAESRLDEVVRVVEACRVELLASRELLERVRPAVDNLTSVVKKMQEQRVPRVGPSRYLKVHAIRGNKTRFAWKQFQNNISNRQLYAENDPVVDKLLKDLCGGRLKYLKPADTSSGTQLHLEFRMTDSSRVLFKPKRFERDYERSPDISIFYDIERHTAEIAAFHLDRVLGFRRVPPVAGCILDIMEDIYELNNELATGIIYKSKADNLCFEGICNMGCDGTHPTCGDGQLLEGAMIAFIPLHDTDEIESPWIRSCKGGSNCTEEEAADHRSIFHRSKNYCPTVRQTPPFDNQRVLLNFIDVHIFDFLTGNMDRHHLYMFTAFGNDSLFPLHDNGKGFGTARRDDLSILSPLYQCCVVRLSTVERLLSFHVGPEHLSDAMRRSLAGDQLDMVLTEAHLTALDRRVAIILAEIHMCMRRSSQPVIVDDGL